MAKALPGFATTSVDPRLIAEIRALRSRVRDLEAELDRVRAENTLLTTSLDETVVLDDREPALT